MKSIIRIILPVFVFSIFIYACQSNKTCPTYGRGDYNPVESKDEEVVFGSPQSTFSNSNKAYKRKVIDGSLGYATTDYEKEYPGGIEPAPQDFNTESYNTIHENKFLSSKENPLSTFSIDVDGASYSNTRRYIESGVLPQKDVVRVEEFINYFSYNYEQPKDQHPFAIASETIDCPWSKDHKLVMIGLQGKRYPFEALPAMNLVFLVDVSGSMSDQNKLPLLKRSLKMLVNKMRPQDHVSIVVYAGAAGLVLPSTPGNEKATIIGSLDRLEAGGSTAGGEGIELAYKVATDNFITNGINRVILATDGDFNIGNTSDADMERLIEKKRELGVFVTVLGFGMGNYKDSKMEIIADKGNGNYYYIDNASEAEKVLVTQIDGTLYTIAKDVKLQIEFNPAVVQSYRLIGYENRIMAKEDFNNDKKDAGELGAGHTVTAIYEIIPVGVKDDQAGTVDPLKYQTYPVVNPKFGDELLTVKFRYKHPKDTVSNLIVKSQKYEAKPYSGASLNLRFACAVAGYGMLLRDSEFKGTLTWDQVISMGMESKGD